MKISKTRKMNKIIIIINWQKENRRYELMPKRKKQSLTELFDSIFQDGLLPNFEDFFTLTRKCKNCFCQKSSFVSKIKSDFFFIYQSMIIYFQYDDFCKYYHSRNTLTKGMSVPKTKIFIY